MSNENAIRYITPADSKGLQSLVTKAIASYGKARVAVQVAAIAILCHAAKHNDYSQASALVIGCGGKTGRDLVKYLKDFGGLKSNEEGTAFVDWSGPDFIADHLEAAKDTVYWQYAQPRGSLFKDYTLEEMAQDFIKSHKRAAKRAAEGKATLDDSLSEVTMQAVLKLVKFDRLANKAQPEAKAA